MSFLPRIEFNNFVKHPLTSIIIVLLFACSTLFFVLKNSYEDRIKVSDAAAAAAYREKDKYLKAYILLLERQAIKDKITVTKDSLLNNKIVIPAKQTIENENSKNNY